MRAVFNRADGQPLHPSYVLQHFNTLCTLWDKAGLAHCRIRDLRNLVATLSITNGVPLTVVSKTLRHSALVRRRGLYRLGPSPSPIVNGAGRARKPVRGPLRVLRQSPRSLRNALAYCSGVVLETELQVGDAYVSEQGVSRSSDQ
jgi:hypothetical protein